MFRRAFVVVMLLGSAALCSAKSGDAWTSGKLLSAGVNHWTANTGSETNGQVDDNGQVHASTTDQSWNYETYNVVIDDGHMQYFAQRTLWLRWQRDPDFIENSTIKFQVKGKKITVVDADGHQFKMVLVKRRIDN